MLVECITVFIIWTCFYSWTVYRCQQLDRSLLKEPEPVKQLVTSVCDWGDDADDWGMPGTSDWGTMEGSDSADSLDKSRPNIEKITNTDDWGNGSEDAGQNHGAEFINSEKDVGTIQKITKGHREEEKVENRNSSTTENSLQLQQMCLDDVEDDRDSTMSDVSDSLSHVLADDILPKLSNEERLQTLKALQSDYSNADFATDNRPLCSFFINVFEEETRVEETGHITELLKNYEENEGCSLREMLVSKR